MKYLFFSLYVLFASSGLILFKLGSGEKARIAMEGGQLQIQLHMWAILGIVCYGVSFLLYLFLVSSYDLSRIFPLSNGCIYLVILAASIFLLKEGYSVMTILGGVLVVSGIALISFSSTT